MKPTDLIAGLCDYLQMSQLEPDNDGVYTIVFDEGLDIEFVALNDKLLLVRSGVSDVPEDPQEHEAFFRGLLRDNLCFLRDQTATLSLDTETEKVSLARTVIVPRQSVNDFCEIVEDFVNTLQWWRSLASRKSTDHTASEFMPSNMLRP